MATKTWTVLDLANNDYIVTAPGAVEPLRLEGASGLSVDKLSVDKWTKRGGMADGLDVLTVISGDVHVNVLPTRGMGIWDAWYQHERIGWKSPVRGPVHPHFVNLGESSGLGWLDGFDELLVRCGLESNGAPDFDDNGKVLYPLHGRIANKPAHKVEVTIDSEAEEITVVGVVEETRFHFLKLRMTSTIKIKAGEQGFRIHDEIENISQSPAGVQMLYHTNFGDPLLDAGAKVMAPIKTIVPRNERAAEGIAGWQSYEAPQPGFEEQVYFFDLLAGENGQTQAMLRNAHGTRGVRLSFNKKQLPCFTVWKNTTSLPDGYVTGLEPATNFPNPRTYEGEQGRVATLKPGGRCAFDFQLEFLSNEGEVEAAEAAIADLQGDTQPQVYDSPQDGWCAP